MSIENVFSFMEENEIKFVDFRFTDSLGKEQHVTVPTSSVDNDLFENGKMFDGSSIRGWQGIDNSDLALIPVPSTARNCPFSEQATLNITCNVVDPTTQQSYGRDPRAVAIRAEQYMKSMGIADECFVGPEPEFFVFDSVKFASNMNKSFYEVDSEEGSWNSDADFQEGNTGHRPAVKGGYFPVPPVDSSQDLRSAMSTILEDLGIVVETHHHEVATSNQNEIGTRYNTLLVKADEMQTFKYVVHNVAHAFGKTATFMPKPLVGDNGSGMHCHISLAKDGQNIFAGDKYAGLSDVALHFIGGIIKHAPAINMFTNPTTNSYKRLVPGYEAPVLLAYSARNRSAAIRIPHVSSPKGRRIEVRFPDATANPYLCFAALLMAGLDGIKNKINPGDAMDKDLYDLPPEELVDIPTVCSSLDQAIYCLEEDHDFLLEGGVFTEDLIESLIELKMEEVQRLRMATTPEEFAMYYSS